MHSDGRTGRFVDALQPSDMIDMRVCDDDRRDPQLMTLNDAEDPLGVVPRINYQSVACFWVADNVAIALQQSDRKNFMNKFGRFQHAPKYSIGRLAKIGRLTAESQFPGSSRTSMQEFQWRRRPAGSVLIPGIAKPPARCRRHLGWLPHRPSTIPSPFAANLNGLVSLNRVTTLAAGDCRCDYS